MEKVNLISVDNLSMSDIGHIFDLTDRYLRMNRTSNKKSDILRGKTIINFFAENSTRTKSSFEIAGKRLGADVINFSMQNSATSKGETFYDTINTLSAMMSDCIIVRHPKSGILNTIQSNINSILINAGDGSNEHPTQALIDAFTIQHNRNTLSGKKIVICGDIKHSRVARSQIKLFSKLGAKIHLVAPSTLMPNYINEWPVEATHTDMIEGLQDADVISVLRIQFERMTESFIPSINEYFDLYGLSRDKLQHAKKDALIIHPGPVNRGIEISNELVDDKTNSAILQQVEIGVALRQAVLHILLLNDNEGNQKNY